MAGLPLFPLPNVVLFPGMMLPLHIFEPRYRQMMHDIMAKDGRFGLQLCKEYDPVSMNGVPFDVGTVAEVIECDILADGRMNILTVGRERFHVKEYYPDKHPYLSGEVVWLEDELSEPMPSEDLEATVETFREAMRLSYKIHQKEYNPCELPKDATALSFCIAEHLKGSLVLKQHLLEMTCPKARLEYEQDVLAKAAKTLAVRCQIEDAFKQ